MRTRNKVVWEKFCPVDEGDNLFMLEVSKKIETRCKITRLSDGETAFLFGDAAAELVEIAERTTREFGRSIDDLLATYDDLFPTDETLWDDAEVED